MALYLSMSFLSDFIFIFSQEASFLANHKLYHFQEHSNYNVIFHNSSKKVIIMITSLSKKQKMLCSGPNYIIFSSANHYYNRSSANTSEPQANPSNQSENIEADKSEPKTFKIRTLTSKSNSVKRPNIERKRIDQEAITCIKEDCQIRILKYQYNYRRPSVHLSKEPNNDRSRRQTKDVKATQSAIFRQIQLKTQKLEKHELHFSPMDLSQFSSLSHPPYIYINSERPAHQAYPEIVVIFSVNLISMNPKRIFFPKERSYSSQRSADYNISASFTIDAQNILKNLCGKSEKSFFNNCKVFLKVSQNSQMNDLKEFLFDNQLLCFDGIINIRGKITETHNVYSIKQLVSQDQKLIILQQEQALRSQIPLIDGNETFFFTLTDRSLTYSYVNKTIKLLKELQIERSRSPSKARESPKKSRFYYEEKENLNPNNDNLIRSFMRTSHLTSNKKTVKNNQKSTLIVTSQLKAKPFEFDWNILREKLHQVNQIKKIKQQIRDNKLNNSKNINLSSTQRSQRSKSRNRSNDGQAQIDNTKETEFKINLEGEFKQKLMKYVKILENQRASQQNQKDNKYREKDESKNDDLQELTTNLTSRLKSKTPYQLVGDTMRNNAHIGRQIQIYMNQIDPIRKVLARQNEIRPEIEREKDKVIYTFQI